MKPLQLTKIKLYRKNKIFNKIKKMKKIKLKLNAIKITIKKEIICKKVKKIMIKHKQKNKSKKI